MARLIGIFLSLLSYSMLIAQVPNSVKTSRPIPRHLVGNTISIQAMRWDYFDGNGFVYNKEPKLFKGMSLGFGLQHAFDERNELQLSGTQFSHTFPHDSNSSCGTVRAIYTERTHLVVIFDYSRTFFRSEFIRLSYLIGMAYKNGSETVDLRCTASYRRAYPHYPQYRTFVLADFGLTAGTRITYRLRYGFRLISEFRTIWYPLRLERFYGFEKIRPRRFQSAAYSANLMVGIGISF